MDKFKPEFPTIGAAIGIVIIVLAVVAVATRVGPVKKLAGL